MACCAPVGYFFYIILPKPEIRVCVCVCAIQLLLERKRFHVIGFAALLPMYTDIYNNMICCIISLGICRRDKQSRVSV